MGIFDKFKILNENFGEEEYGVGRFSKEMWVL